MQQAISTWKHTTNGLTVSDIREIVQTVTVSIAINAPKETRVWYLNKENPGFLRQTLFNTLMGLIRALNFKPLLPDEEVRQLVDELIKSCPDWSIQDFLLCFKNGKLGKYCEFYNSINGAKIFEMVLGYETERAIEREREMAANKVGHTQAVEQLSRSEAIVEAMKNVNAKMEEVKKTTPGLFSDIKKAMLKLAKVPLELMAHIGGQVLNGVIQDPAKFEIDNFELIKEIQNFYKPFAESYQKRELDYQGVITTWTKEIGYVLKDEVIALCEKITEVFE